MNRSVTYLRRHASELLEQVNRERLPVVIARGGRPCAVILDPASYVEMRSTIDMLVKIVRSEIEIGAGETVDQDELMSRLEKKLR